MEEIISGLSPLRLHARRSITFDRGLAFTAWPHLQAGLGVAVWLCDRQARLQKGTSENTNGRARRVLPRDADPAMPTNRAVAVICRRLTTTPRQCLGDRTPRRSLPRKGPGRRSHPALTCPPFKCAFPPESIGADDARPHGSELLRGGTQNEIVHVHIGRLRDREPGVSATQSRRRPLGICLPDQPGSATSPCAVIAAMAQASSLSEVSPVMPTAPMICPSCRISTPPGTGTSAPPASAFIDWMK